MGSRLVLGCGGVGQQVVDSLSPQDDPLLVIADDETLVQSLREDGIPARVGDPDDPSVLEPVDEPTQTFVGADEAAVNRTAAENVRERFPESYVVAYAGRDEPVDMPAHVTVSEPGAMAHWVSDRATGRRAEGAMQLYRHLSALEGPLAVVTHDNPDPDALASAVALVDIAAAVGLEAQACYHGEISHQENRAMVNLLDLDVRRLDPEESLGEFSSFALVDHARPGVNDQLPPELHVDIVVDHHPPRGPVPAVLYDRREDAGATSTVLAEYIDWLGVPLTERTATALLFGIQVDTNDFRREVSAVDFTAASLLLGTADTKLLERIENPRVDGETLDAIARAIKDRQTRGSVVVANAGYISSRDALPQAADQLLALEDIDTTLVFGFVEDMVYVSARSRASSIDLGETLRDAFSPIGSAGGHTDMAGAQLEIGMMAGFDGDEATEDIVGTVEEVITGRFFEAIRTRPGTPVSAYRETSERLFRTDEESDE